MLAGAVKQPGLRKGSGRGKPAPAHTEPGAGSGLREGAALLVLQAAGQTRALPFSAGGFRGSLDMSPQGRLFVIGGLSDDLDIDECALRTHTCWNDSACINLAGGFDCLCASGPSCSGDCPHEGGLKRNGQVWTLKEDRCSVCSCKLLVVLSGRQTCSE
ncbi:hypothetical protein CB1_056579092 [Camelus ferus]|nr:hypothetical protein CB1_056579092 [Camelus ferus]